MTLKRVGFHIDPEFAKKHGVDLLDPQALKHYKERNEQMEVKYTKAAKRRHIELIWDQSLWNSGEIEFAFSNWKPEERSNVQKARNLGNKAYKLSHFLLNNNFNVVMSGEAGVGKTSLALAMVTFLREHGKTALFVSTDELLSMISNQYDYEDVRQQLNRTKKAMYTADVLLLDDLGAEGGSISKVNGDHYSGVRQDMQRFMQDVANNRYEGTQEEQNNARKKGIKLPKPAHSTIITTNNTTDELERIYAHRTISRLITRDSNHRLAFNDMEDMRMKEGL